MRKLIALLLLPLTLVLTALASPASAVTYYETDPEFGHNASIAVASVADIRKRGDTVRWSVRFTCPKGKRYTLRASVAHLNQSSHPGIMDGDNAVEAILEKPLTGQCTGKRQTRSFTLRTQVSRWHEGCIGSPDNGNQQCFSAGSGYFPIEPTRQGYGEAGAYILGNGFRASYIAYAAAASNSGPYITIR